MVKMKKKLLKLPPLNYLFLSLICCPILFIPELCRYWLINRVAYLVLSSNLHTKVGCFLLLLIQLVSDYNGFCYMLTYY